MFNDDGGVAPEDRRSPFEGSSVLWWGIAIALIVLTLALVLPTLGQGPTQSPEDPLAPTPRERTPEIVPA